MRQTISIMVAALAVVAASAAPAAACGGGRGLFTSGCSPCGSPCGGGYSSYGYSAGYSYGYAGVAAYQQLPVLVPQYVAAPQYYYVNQGPSYSGPGNFAPYPAYQEGGVSGYSSYTTPYSNGYGGGYSAASESDYDGAADVAPSYSYRPRVQYRPWRPRPSYYGYSRRMSYQYAPRHSYEYAPRPSYRHGYSMRPSYRYGYAPHRSYAPRYSMAPRQYAVQRSYAPRAYGHRAPVLRRYY